MDQNRNDNVSSPNITLGFLWLLFGEDWHRWDGFPTIDGDQTIEIRHDDDVPITEYAPVTNVEINHDAPITESAPVTNVESVRHWLRSVNDEHFGPPPEELAVTSVEDSYAYEYEREMQWLEPLTFVRFEPLPPLNEDNELASNDSLTFEELLILAEQQNELTSDDDGDSFTYEELLLIAEQRGDVHTGLNPEAIDEALKPKIFEVCCGEMEACVICQEELKDNEEASKLGCEHVFHFACIKEWLMVKNSCPLCKQKAI